MRPCRSTACLKWSSIGCSILSGKRSNWKNIPVMERTKYFVYMVSSTKRKHARTDTDRPELRARVWRRASTAHRSVVLISNGVLWIRNLRENEKWRVANQSFSLTKPKSRKTTNLLCTFPSNFDTPLARMATGKRRGVPLLHTKIFSRKPPFVFQFSCKLNCSHSTLFLRRINN